MKKKTIIRIIYICAFLIISLIPLFTFNSNQKAIGNEVKKKMPSLTTEAGLNLNYFSEFDDYFAQNFGMRNNLVQLGNSMKAMLFGISGNDSVVKGNSGWLFYGSALDDYLGRNTLSDVEIAKIANELDLVDYYVKGLGKDFIFTVAPNKMSIYGEYMPYNYIQSKEPGNYEKLFAKLKNYDLISVDLKTALIKHKNTFDTDIYHKLDSHWNNLGAAVAYETIMSNIFDAKTKDYTKAGFGVVKDFKGDLQAMLFPDSEELDDQIKLNIFDGIVYGDTFKSSEDLRFTTSNSLAVNDKSVVLYRDSFGNALYWFFANDFANTLIKREIPYNIYKDAQENDIVVVEIVERNIRNLLKNVPIVPSYKIGTVEDAFKTNDGRTIVDIYGNSSNLKAVDGIVEAFGSVKQEGLYEITFNCEVLKDYADIYLMTFDLIEGISMYQAMPAGKDCEATIYLPTKDYSYVTENRANTYIVAVDSEGATIRLPINYKLQN